MKSGTSSMKLLTNKTEITLLLMTSYYIIHIYTGYNWQIAPFINPPFLKKKSFFKKKKKTPLPTRKKDSWMRQKFHLPFTTSHAMEIIFLRMQSSKKPINNKASSSSCTIPWRKAG